MGKKILFIKFEIRIFDQVIIMPDHLDLKIQLNNHCGYRTQLRL